MITNLAYFYETSRKIRGGKFVWVKDGNGESRKNITLGGTIANPNKGLGHLWAAQLLQYKPNEPIYIFRSFAMFANAEADATTIYLRGDGYGDAPEVGMIIMKAPSTVDTTGQSSVVTGVEYDATNEKFKVTLSVALGALTTSDILVEATGTEASASAKVLVPNPNIFNEVDRDLLPTEGYGVENANYSISGVYDKEAYVERLQPLPSYVLAKNRSYIEGIFWI